MNIIEQDTSHLWSLAFRSALNDADWDIIPSHNVRAPISTFKKRPPVPEPVVPSLSRALSLSLPLSPKSKESEQDPSEKNGLEKLQEDLQKKRDETANYFQSMFQQQPTDS